MEKELTRETVDPRYTWDLTRIYASDEAWEEAFAAVKAQAEAFAKRAGTLSHGREAVLDSLAAMMRMDETFFALHAYAMMKNNEDSTNAKYQAMSDRAGTLAGVVAAACSFMEPELLALEEGEIEKMIADPAFAEYDRYLSGVLRMKAHTLTASEEKLMAMASDACNAAATAYEMLSYADMNLGKTRGENGEKVQLTDARLLSLLSSKDRAVRKAAYTNIMNGYNKFGNTIAATYAGQVKADIFNSRAHHFDSSRQAAMFPDEIDEKVYDSLIEAVHGGIGTLNEYLSVKKEQLGVPVLHMYDLYAEAENSFEIGMDVEEAFKVFLKAVKPLGEDYVKDASRALPERWIDVYETKNKRSGAYSCGSAYRTTPYVLLNHKNTYDGLSTLCHEMGHAMHSFYSNKNQPFAKADYTIFVAEVASTCNEILLSEYLRKQYAGNKQAQIALIGSLLQHFRTTVFRQTMFAEFEYKAHCMAESGESLTRDSLSAMYYDLNKLYYGGACKVDREVAYEWMRIPHFYNSFYVYKYATSFCAAVTLSRGILDGDKEKLAAYGIETISTAYSGDGVENVANAIGEARKTGADLILCTGGMSVDPDDNTPGGIRASGARIVTYGAPVLPGAMFLLGYFEDGTPICGLPGCVMYAGATIFDLALPRIAAGVELTRRDFAVMGEGGLCLGCKPCRYPVCPFGK